MPQELPAEIGEMIQSFLGRRLYVILSGPSDPDAALPLGLLGEHLRWLVEQEQRGVLFAGGPFLIDAEPGAESMYILRAASIDEARQIADAEPYHRGGHRRYELKEWAINQGRVTLSLDFSSQRGALDR